MLHVDRVVRRCHPSRIAQIQTCLYAAKGGQTFVLVSAAGRPLISAVGRSRAATNGTCLDYLAESFMAGDRCRAAASPS